MKKLLSFVVLIAAGLLLLPFAGTVQAAEERSATPPIAQTLVREGDFAVGLAEALAVSGAEDEAAAESKLAELGIAPRNGWIADYPMTPDIVDEVRDAVATSTDAGLLKMTKDEAMRKIDNLTAGLSLPIRPGENTEYARQEPQGDSSGDESGGEYTDYPEPGTVNNYYYTEGPPVVTYYTPPWDYYYLYNWVPYPFWWGSFHFGGFFVLNDFHSFRRVHFFDKRFNRTGFRRVTNQVFDRNRGRVTRINAVDRLRGARDGQLAGNADQRGFRNADARRGAESIFRRNNEAANRGLAGNSELGRRNALTNQSGGKSPEQNVRTNSNLGRGNDGTARNANTNRGGGSFQAGTRPSETNRSPSNRSGRLVNGGIKDSRGRPAGGGGSVATRSAPNEMRSFGGSRGAGSGSELRGRSNSLGGNSIQRGFSGGGGSGRPAFSGGGSGSRSFSGGRSFSSGGGFSGGSSSGSRGFSGGGGFSRGGGGGGFSRGGGGGGFSRGGGGGGGRRGG